MARIMVIGGGGIGQAFAQYSNMQGEEVFLLGRNSRSANIPRNLSLDIENETVLSGIANFVADNKIDAFVNTLGLLHQDTASPEKTISQLDETWFIESIKVNCLSSLLFLKHLNQNLDKNSHLKFVALSARVGSISDNHLGGWLSYRVSKSALNMGLKTASIEWKYKYKNAVIVAYHPGTVDTKLSKPFQANVKRLFSPEEASGYLYTFIKTLTPDMSGGFYSWKNETIPF